MAKILVMDSGSFKLVGGAANATYPIYRHLQDAGYDVDLFADFSNIDKRSKSVDVKKLKTEKYDAVMLNSIRDGEFVVRYLKRGPSKSAKYIYVDRGNVLINYAQAGVKRLLPKMIIRQAIMHKMRGWLDCYVALSAEQYSYAKTFFEQRTELAYLPINSSRVFKKTKGVKKASVGIYVGRLDEKQKKVGRLIKGVERAIELHPELSEHHLLLLVGTGPYESDYKKYVREHGLQKNIGFIGHVVDERRLARLYNEAGFFVSYSEWEGMARTFVEAMSCGLPMLVNQRNNTVIGYKPETHIVEDQYNGLVFDYYDVDDFAEKFYKLYSENETRDRLSKNSLESAEAFDNDEILENFKKIFDRLIQGKSVSDIVFKE